MIVIADDLTGANDTGVQFVKQGRRTVVHLTPSPDSVMYKDKINVINTDSRSLSPEEAYKQNRSFVKTLSIDPQPVIFKKVDSTLRGNIGREIDALMDELTFSFCAVVPAYPQNDRKTIGGYHLVRGELLEDSELRNDVKFPMTESYIPALLEKQSHRKVGLITIKMIRKGHLAEEVQLLLSGGAEIIVFDGAIDTDLQTVSAFLKNEENVLWVGSAGLANALSSESDTVQVEEKEQSLSQLPTLTIAGSVTKITREQVKYLEEQGNYVIALHPIDLLNDEDTILQAHLDEAQSILGDKKDLVITTLLSDEIATEVQLYSSKMELDKLEVGNTIATKLGSFASRLIKKAEVSGLILTGGDIAYQTCLQLDINALEVVKEVEEGIPLSKVVDGPFANTAIVTKAGAFGDHSSLHHAMIMIKNTQL